MSPSDMWTRPVDVYEGACAGIREFINGLIVVCALRLVDDSMHQGLFQASRWPDGAEFMRGRTRNMRLTIYAMKNRNIYRFDNAGTENDDQSETKMAQGVNYK